MRFREIAAVVLCLLSFEGECAGGSTGAATLVWAPPTQNVDGTTLVDLAGYRIYYGLGAKSLNRVISVNDPWVNQHVLKGLAAGYWYFAMTSITQSGVESRRSRTVSKRVG
jgi:hypothetical protein